MRIPLETIVIPVLGACVELVGLTVVFDAVVLVVTLVLGIVILVVTLVLDIVILVVGTAIDVELIGTEGIVG